MSNRFDLDSLKIRIPIEDVKVINTALQGTWLKVNSKTGEVLPDDFNKNSYPIEENGIKTKYLIRSFPIEFRTVREFLFIQFNSKLLKQKYLDGITAKNIKQIYNELMSQQIVKFSYKTFLSGMVTDADFKKDKHSTRYNFSKFTRYLESISKENLLVKRYDKKTNKGIEWSKRDNTDLKYPFTKIYLKGLELKNHSVEFYENYILDTESDTDYLDSTYRMEFTAKNKKYFKKFGINDTSLQSILNLSDETKETMFTDNITKHINIYEVKPVHIKEGLIANQKINLNAMSMLMQTEMYTVEKMIDYLLTGIEDSQKRKKRKQLKDLYKNTFKTNLNKHEREGKIRELVRQMLFD